jgi:hypothetical protein
MWPRLTFYNSYCRCLIAVILVATYSLAVPLSGRGKAKSPTAPPAPIVSIKSPGKAAGKDQRNVPVSRTITFPKRSLGGLYLVQIYELGQWGPEPTEVAVAKGTVTITIPPNQSLALRTNSMILTEPALFGSLPPDGLDALEISATPFDEAEDATSDKALSYVADLTGLKQLILKQFEATDKGLSELKSLKHLQHLTSVLGKANGFCLKDLAELPELFNLDLSHNPIKQENLQYLAGFHKLARLVLHRCQLGEEGVKNISKCKTITMLAINLNPKVNDNCMKYLAQLPNLRSLDLASTGVTIKGLEYLRELKNLRGVTISEGLFDRYQLPTIQKLLPKTIITFSKGSKIPDSFTQRVLAPLPK